MHYQFVLGKYSNEDYGRLGLQRYHIVSILIW